MVLCPGGRNAPMIQALGLVAKAWNLEVLSFFEERSAGFFALGRAKRDQRPVIVTVTSGTAAAELLPAVIEAHATAVPLIVVTADRPRQHRGSGSPQSMWQLGLFTHYAPTLLDWQEGEPHDEWLTRWDQRTPIHLNMCHQEPLWDKSSVVAPPAPTEQTRPAALAPITSPVPQLRRPLIMLGALAPEERPAVEQFCRWYGAPVLAEASSGLREIDHLLWTQAGERIVRAWWKRGEFDGVIRFGAVPSWRLWRDLETWSGSVLTFGSSAWSGLPGRAVQRGQLKAWLEHWTEHGTPVEVRTALHEEDRALAQKTERLMREYPEAEPSLVRKLSEKIPEQSLVYVGNSRPVRDWNDFATRKVRFELQENRGMNGIDGQVSSFLGHARANQENWSLLGDLTTMYDLAGLWAMRHLPQNSRVRLIVMNNGGGRIFERLFPTTSFINEHDIEFSAWARMWKCDYAQNLEHLSDRVVIELKPDNEQTRAFRDQAERP